MYEITRPFSSRTSARVPQLVGMKLLFIGSLGRFILSARLLHIEIGFEFILDRGVFSVSGHNAGLERQLGQLFEGLSQDPSVAAGQIGSSAGSFK